MTGIELRVIPYVRWTARIVGTVLVAMVLLVAIGESVGGDAPDFANLAMRERLMFLGLGLEMLGLVLAWKWEGVGVGLTLLGYTLFQLFEGKLFTPPLLPLFLVLALMFGYCWLRGRERRVEEETIGSQ